MSQHTCLESLCMWLNHIQSSSNVVILVKNGQIPRQKKRKTELLTLWHFMCLLCKIIIKKQQNKPKKHSGTFPGRGEKGKPCCTNGFPFCKWVDKQVLLRAEPLKISYNLRTSIDFNELSLSMTNTGNHPISQSHWIKSVYNFPFFRLDLELAQGDLQLNAGF